MPTEKDAQVEAPDLPLPDLLKYLRKAAGMTQAQEAERLCALTGTWTVTRHEVGRWEQGRVRPDAWLPALAEVLDIDLQVLQKAPTRRSPTAQYPDSGGNSELTRAPNFDEDYLSSRRSSTPTEEVRQLGRPSIAPSFVPLTYTPLNGVDPNADSELDVETLHAFRAADRQVGGGHLYATVINFLQTVLAPRLFGGQAADGGGVFTAAAGFTEMAGWMAHDAGHDAAAERHFRRALDLSKMGRDAQLGAHVYASLSHLYLHLNVPQDAIQLARQGHAALAEASPAPALSARLLAMEARGRAAAGDSADCADALLRAEKVLDQSPADEMSPWVSPFDAGSLASEAARCMRQLGQLGEAERQARSIIELRVGNRTRSRAFGQLSLVGVLIEQGRPDEACALAYEVLDTTQALSSHLVTQQLQELQSLLMPYRSSREVDGFLPLLSEAVRQRLGLYGWLGSGA